MAAKLLHSLTDDNPDLQKEIGCMTGVFQLFDRHHVLAGRRIAGYSPKRLPHGSSHFNNETLERETNNLPHRPPVMEKNSNKNVHDKLRTSTDSSRASFSSSSRSSSFSSLDCNKQVQLETLSFDRIIFPETPSRDPTMSQSGASPQFGRQSLDLCDFVKDSMYRELRALSPKTTIKEEATDRAFRHRDSPRPIQQSKTNDSAYSMGLGVDSKQNMPADLKESLKVLAKLREAPRYFDEPRELSRSKSYQLKEGSLLSSSKDPPRFSYDGRREVNRLSFDSKDNAKPALKVKELPRLSLDSRESSMRGLNSDTKFNFQLKSGNRDSHNFGDTAVIVQKTSGTQTRPSVVAQLMGLDTLPHSGSISDNNMGSGLGLFTTRRPEDFDSLSRSLKTTKHGEPIRIPSPSRISLNEPKSPRWKNPDTVVMKPISRFPIEPAPWRHQEGARNSQKLASRKAPAKTQITFPSVYSEIENRLKHLEFTQSGKDLRALEQILESMQSKGFIETRNNGQDSHFLTQKDHEQRFSNLTQNERLLNQRKPQGHIISSANRGSTSSRAIDSSIVIMKPAKLVEKSTISSVDSRKVSVNSKAIKDQVPKSSRRDYTVNSSDMKTSGRHLKPAQTSTRNQQLSKESGTSSAKSSGSISPRLQQKKLELEKRARPPTPPDLSKSRKHISRQQVESNSPGGRRRPKFACYQPGNDQSSEISTETRKSNYQETDMAVESDSERYGDSNSSPSLSIKVGVKSPTTKTKKSTPIHRENESFAELTSVGQEYPSPVSVLDDVVYLHDSLSPVKHVLKTSNDDVKERWTTEDDVISSTTGSGLTSEINRKKLQNVEHLVQKLRRLNSCHDEGRTDYIASLCENTNPDDRYISEILLASGLLLRDLGSSLTTFQFHPSGHPINPELFLVLEQTKCSSLLKEAQRKPDKERFHRKLIFDTVNEILVGKLASVGQTPEPWLRPFKLARKAMNAQQLLRELCMEVTELQAKKPECSEDEDNDDDGLKGILWEDVNRRSESWTDNSVEIQVIVLEVERLIFKDLVNEIVMHEASGLRAKQQASRRCRQLFVK